HIRDKQHGLFTPQHFQSVLDRCSVGHPDQAVALTKLAWARLEGYFQTVIKTDSIISHEALALHPPGYSDRPLFIYHLLNGICATVLQAREQQHHGRGKWLDECIQCRHAAVFLCSERHSEHETYLNSLALSLDYRSDHRGNSHDLNEAISLYEETLCLCRAGHRSRDPFKC
ncbi:uncharacterized protein F5891DRAFT_952696, partial [Suillus fuscotomentosus]